MGMGYLCSELVTITWDDGERCGNLEQIGEWTTLVLLEDPIPLGSRAHIRCKEYELKGVVTACEVEEPLGFFVEVGLGPGFTVV